MLRENLFVEELCPSLEIQCSLRCFMYFIQKYTFTHLTLLRILFLLTPYSVELVPGEMSLLFLVELFFLHTHGFLSLNFNP